jgi:hypothetical protein
MGHIPATTFGIGAPATYSPWAFSLGIPQLPPQLLGQSFQPQTFAGYGTSSLQQTPPLVQILAQQLQQVQLLQQQQLLYLHQLLQIVPAQLQQLQQLIQIGPQQLQQQWPPSMQAGPFGLGAAQPFAGPGSGLVM